jgi:hypothetical protein
MDNNIYHLGFFIISTLPFLINIMKTSLSNTSINPLVNDIIEQNKTFDIIITIDNEFMNLSFKDRFICRINVNDN